jgi:glutamate racemase
MRNPQPSPIGVFDSGVGGLTVLRELYQQLPQESLLYFGDTARLPYGDRSPAEILQFVREILTWMEGQGIKMAIMACNTSSALALETVRQEFHFPILGLILPGARAAVRRGRRIGVIATPATAASNAYYHAIQEIDVAVQVWQVGCPEFVPLIEQERLSDPYTQKIARQYLQPLLERQIDTLIYGCTHYRHLESTLRGILPPAVQLVDPAEYVVRAAEKELELMGLKGSLSAPQTRFCVSGCPKRFAQLSQRWLGYYPTVEKIRLPVRANLGVPLEILE